MAHRSGNATWVDYPSTSTLVSAARLENIENAIDTPAALPFVYLTQSSQSVTTGFVEILWPTEGEDASGMHDTVSNTGRVTIPTGLGGLYRVDAIVPFFGNAFTTDRSIQILKNGTTMLDVSFNRRSTENATTDATTLFAGLTMRLAAADYVQIQKWSGDTGTVKTCTFTVTRLGS